MFPRQQKFLFDFELFENYNFNERRFLNEKRGFVINY